LAQVGLEEFADEQVGGFSAGMRKRLTLLRTGLEAPRLVLWDEPFSSLDPEGRQLLAEWVAEFRSRGVSMMLATHDLDLGARLCDRAVVLERGQMIWSGPADGATGQLEALR